MSFKNQYLNELMERVIVAMIYAAPILADLAKEAEQTAETPQE